jgi:hypothetical protein
VSVKLTGDRIDGLPGVLIRGRHRVFALGPEVQLALARRQTRYRFLKVNYQWETYAARNDHAGQRTHDPRHVSVEAAETAMRSAGAMNLPARPASKVVAPGAVHVF